MAIESGSLLGGGVFVADSISGNTVVPVGSSGVLITLTPPTGQRVMINTLSCSATAVEANISVTVGGNSVISGKTLTGLDSDAAGEFHVANTSFHPGNGAGGALSFIMGGVGEVIVVVKDSGSTSASVFYNYAFGRVR